MSNIVETLEAVLVEARNLTAELIHAYEQQQTDIIELTRQRDALLEEKREALEDARGDAWGRDTKS